MRKPRFVVIIPTYLRVETLQKCLAALENQTVPPEEIIIVRRDTDLATAEFIKKYQKAVKPFAVTEKEVSVPGYLPPISAGLKSANGDYVAILDDDAIARPDWVEKSVEIFRASKPNVGALNGAMVCHQEEAGSVYPARISFWGRFAIVDKKKINKKINALVEGDMILRGEAVKNIAIDLRLNRGRVAHHGLDIGLQLLSCGWQIVYAPVLNVEHLAIQAPNSPENPADIETFIGNLALIIKKHFGTKRLWLFVLYNLLVGQYQMPGLVYFLVKNKNSWRALKTAQFSLIRQLQESR